MIGMISIKLIVGVILLLFILFVLLTGYVKAPPDVAYIISGIRRTPKVLIGRAGIKIPLLERKDFLIVKQISIDVKTNGYIPTFDFIGVDIDAVCKVRVITDDTVMIGDGDNVREVRGIDLAAKNFLNMGEDQIADALVDSLQGNMREIIGTVPLRELCNDRKKFGDEVQSKAQKDMNALGIEIISCNIQRITDENDLIPALGQDNMSQIQKDASIAKANADRDVAIAEAKAAKEANEAKVQSDTDIAERQNELAIKKAALKQKEDTAKAQADAAYAIQEQEQQKAINTATVNAEIAKTEREAELKEKAVAVKKQELSAEIERQADADKYRKAQEAEAELIQEKKKAEAVRYALEQEAAGIKAKGEAEAAAIKAKGEAEAAAMEKKADAYKKYGQAAIVQMLVGVLPDVAKSVAEPITAIDNLNIYDGGSGDGAASISGMSPVVMKQVFDTMSEATGVDLREIMKAQTIEAKTDRHIRFDNVPEIKVSSEKSETNEPEIDVKTEE